MIGQIVVLSENGIAVSKKAFLKIEMGIAGLMGQRETGPKTKNIIAEGYYKNGEVKGEVKFLFVVGKMKYKGTGNVIGDKDKQLTLRLTGELDNDTNKLIKQIKQWQVS